MAIARTAASAAPDVALPTIVCILADSLNMTGAVRSGRVLALDIGRRRTGLALSDPTRTLATPYGVITAQPPLAEVLRTADQLAAESDGLSAIVVGRPLHLDGRASAETADVDAFVARLRTRTALPVFVQDERLSSVEAERRLSVGERDWRKRKPRLDAAAAAVILQDFLDTDPRRTAPGRRSAKSRAGPLMRALIRLLVLAVVVAAVGAVAVRSLNQPFQGYAEPEIFVDIPHGLGVAAIGHRLVESGVIKSDWAFRLAVWRRGAARTLKAGEYRFTGQMRADRRGRPARRAASVFLRPVTFPEGLTIAEMAAVFESAGLGQGRCSRRRRGAARSSTTIDATADDLEGYLFPETYNLPARRRGGDARRADGAALPRRLRHEAARRGPGARADDASGGDDRVAHREGDEPARGAAAGVGGLPEPDAHRHGDAVRSDGDLRAAARRPLERQPDAREPAVRFALQHVSLQRPAARPDRRARPRLARSRGRAGRRRRISTSSAATTAHTSSRRRSPSTTATCTSTRSSTSAISAALAESETISAGRTTSEQHRELHPEQ